MAAVEARDEAIARLHTDPIALVGQTFAWSRGSREAQTAWYSPLEAKERRQHAQSVIEPETAEIFLLLAKEAKLPSWVMDYVDFELVRQAA